MERRQGIHYGWVIAAIGFLIIFACIGLGRYAYTMLLPSMQAGLGLSYERMGFIGTGNFCGYLLSVIAAPRLIRRYRPRAVIVAGMALITAALFCLGSCRGFAAPLACYFLVGVGTGCANIPTMALISHWFRSDRRGRAAGLMIGGNGAAIMLAGFLVPALNRWFGGNGWRAAWVLLAAAALPVTLLAARFIRNSPAELGLEPVGRKGDAPHREDTGERPGDGALLVKLGMLYFCFGATFMVFGTFIVTTMVREYGFSETRAGMYWSLAGFFSLFSGLLFGTLSDRIGRREGLAMVFSVQCCAYLLAAFAPGSAWLIPAIILYGLAVFAIPAIMAAAVGDYLGAHRAAGAFATVTMFFAAGQTAGPALAGMMAGYTGSFSGAYALAALLTAAAAAAGRALPEPAVRRL